LTVSFSPLHAARRGTKAFAHQCAAWFKTGPF
jgi:hypothetical protein